MTDALCALMWTLAAVAVPAGGGAAEMDGVTGATPRHHVPGTSAPVPSPAADVAGPVQSPRPGADACAAPAARVRKVLCASRTSAGREFLAAALAAKGVEARVGGPELVPDSVRGLIPYDCVVLSNIPRSSLGEARMRALARYVREYGGGLVVLGGPGSLGPAFAGTPLEEILPVTMGAGARFGREEALPLCIVLLIDSSGSMGQGSGGKIAAARDSAEEVVGHLKPDDMLCIIAFDTTYQVLFPFGPVGEDRQRVRGLVREIEASGDTVISKPMEEGLRQMGDSPCRVKRVILITDGAAKDLSEYDYRGLIREYVRSGVTISAFGVGGDADNNFLRALALGTEGDYAHVKDVRELPLAVLRQTRTATVESGFVDGTVVPKPASKSFLLEGVPRRQIPGVRGYSVMSAKPGAGVALCTDVRGSRDPLLACWRCGRGKTVVWASDAEGQWAGGAADAKGAGKFWSRLVRWAMRAN